MSDDKTKHTIELTGEPLAEIKPGIYYLKMTDGRTITAQVGVVPGMGPWWVPVRDSPGPTTKATDDWRDVRGAILVSSLPNQGTAWAHIALEAKARAAVESYIPDEAARQVEREELLDWIYSAARALEDAPGLAERTASAEKRVGLRPDAQADTAQNLLADALTKIHGKAPTTLVDCASRAAEVIASLAAQALADALAKVRSMPLVPEDGVNWVGVTRMLSERMAKYSPGLGSLQALSERVDRLEQMVAAALVKGGAPFHRIVTEPVRTETRAIDPPTETPVGDRVELKAALEPWTMPQEDAGNGPPVPQDVSEAAPDFAKRKADVARRRLNPMYEPTNRDAALEPWTMPQEDLDLVCNILARTGATSMERAVLAVGRLLKRWRTAANELGNYRDEGLPARQQELALLRERDEVICELFALVAP